jgi:hypothetical protein
VLDPLGARRPARAASGLHREHLRGGVPEDGAHEPRGRADSWGHLFIRLGVHDGRRLRAALGLFYPVHLRRRASASLVRGTRLLGSADRRAAARMRARRRAVPLHEPAVALLRSHAFEHGSLRRRAPAPSRAGPARPRRPLRRRETMPGGPAGSRLSDLHCARPCRLRRARTSSAELRHRHRLPGRDELHLRSPAVPGKAVHGGLHRR